MREKEVDGRMSPLLYIYQMEEVSTHCTSVIRKQLTTLTRLHQLTPVQWRDRLTLPSPATLILLFCIQFAAASDI